ncbi:VWA domain-containing protein [Antarcticibacterium flavum]|uniref:VWA domain-containing protein n=1 Tax=Antarcticibacterium flavum TaxID=2058175 RepID=A0A5B7X2N6_9FLAO|nr:MULTISPECIES: VWA domain-containing protein [Antarcticibacterium]MCM4159129.1 BatB protein [Antarcticibacterium sp. W02-3]QCY69530.1 VWA domain-containing protein [Antarcticibacterium flavum]
MFILEEGKYFWLLLIVPVLLFFYAILYLWKKRKQKQFAAPGMLQHLSPDRSWFKPALKFGLILLALASLAIALANPKIGTKMEMVTREGVDIVFAIDVSKSMEAEDVAPNRLEKSKQLVNQVLNNLASDRVGIIAYAGSAFPQLPITTDYSSARMFLQALNTDMVSSQGTAIGDAIELSKTYFNPQEPTSKVLVIISDGEDHLGEVTSVAKDAANEGIRIVTIGVGTPRGGPIPMKRGGVVQSYKKDQSGETVITRLEEQTLKDIAAATNGIYISGNVTAEVTENMTDFLGNLDKTEFESRQFAEYQSQFQWFLGLAILLLLVDIFLLERKTAWVKKLNLFNERRAVKK